MDQPGSPAPSSASAHADANLRAGLTLLRQTQPQLARLVESTPQNLNFIYARDGCLTARDPSGRWISGCSLPLRAAQELLESLHPARNTACFLHPTHAAQLVVALDRHHPTQALIIILSDPDLLRFILCCHDFSAALGAQRLWFVVGYDWPDQLTRLLHEHEGLSIATMFIRLPLLPEEQAQADIKQASAIFTEQTQQRNQRISAIAADWCRSTDATDATSPNRPICLVAPGSFHLWDDGGWLLAEALAGADGSSVRIFDPDQPLNNSALTFATAACQSSAVLTAGTFRSDMADILPLALPWLTLATSPRIAPPVNGAEHDLLLVVDQTQVAQGQAAGWSPSRIKVVGWPRSSIHPSLATPPSSAPPRITLITDTSDTATPPVPLDLSSQQLLWDLINQEISKNPFVIGSDINRYLDQRRQQLDIASQGLDRVLFIDRLIVPAFTQAIVRLLLQQGIDLQIHGCGWDQIGVPEKNRAGPIRSRAEFLSVINQASILLHPWPVLGAHCIDAWQRPVVRALQVDQSALMRQITLALNHKLSPAPLAHWSVDQIHKLLNE